MAAWHGRGTGRGTGRDPAGEDVDAHFYSAKHFVPPVRKNNWGRFVNVSTDAIALVVKGLSHYMASKMGETGFVRGLANDVAGYGITVNAVLPTIVNTPGASGISDEFKASVVEQQAIERLAKPEGMVGQIVFLASAIVAATTGETAGRRAAAEPERGKDGAIDSGEVARY